MQVEEFQRAILNWFDAHGRKDLPWQQQPTPYRVWISEIMLQQTQVATVIPYFQRFMAAFPDLDSLARAPLNEVLRLWAGLGYYARARNLHKTAAIIAAHGHFPETLEALCALPGIGRSTAGAILSIGCKSSAPILDGNVKRVLSRYHGLEGWPGDSKVSRELWQISARYTPAWRTDAYTQAMMDLGATLCTRTQPKCMVCPLAEDCSANREKRTHELPAPKPRAKPTVKRCVFLLAINRERAVFLQQRPPTGIWGGLWSLPQFDETATALAWCRENIGNIQSYGLAVERRHSFTHYHLDYTPLLAFIENPMDIVLEAKRSVWYKIQNTDAYGLPAPVKRLLDQLDNNEELL